MGSSLKVLLKNMLRAGGEAVGRTSLGRWARAEIVNGAMRPTRGVTHDGTRFTFAAPNALNDFRAETFSQKEPETLEWIDRMPMGATLWDIGANVGLYTCYAAKRRKCRVFSFEPSVFNLELLARNIFLNGLTDRVTIVPLAVSDELSASTLNMSSTQWGGALSTFGKPFGFDGQPLERVFDFSTIGISLTDALDRLMIPRPDYIKLDVDGIEHLILAQGGPVLETVQGVLVEINDAYEEQAVVSERALRYAGLRLVGKYGWEGAVDGPHQTTFNQIWERA